MATENVRIRPFNTRTPPRHIIVFHSPAGTPGSSLFGSKHGEVHLTRYLTRNSAAEHWGVLVQGEHGAESTFFELNRPPDRDIGVLVRSRTQREREEGGEKARKLYAVSDAYTMKTWPGIQKVQEEAKAKDDSMRLRYANTGFLTEWTDEEIEVCAEIICRENMRGQYHLTKANCQTFVNLLLQRIVTGKEPYAPFSTASHALSKQLSKKHLLGLHEFDETVPVKLKGERHPDAADFEQMMEKHAVPRQMFQDVIGGEPQPDELVDLEWLATPTGAIDEVRQNAQYRAGGWKRPSDPLNAIRDIIVQQRTGHGDDQHTVINTLPEPLGRVP